MIVNLKRKKWLGSLAAIILIAVFLTALAGCGKTDIDTPANKPETSATPPTTASILPVSDNGNTGAETSSPAADSDKAYFGQWAVSKVLAFGPAGTYSKEDAEKLVGLAMIFSEEQAVLINDQPSDQATVIEKPDYQESAITKDVFQTDYQMSFDQLGITTESVTAVAVSGQDVGGCTLLLKDENTMILMAGGTYFELTRGE
jgi:predicted small lipoprotein YifL